jgi:hypothetical protein
MSPYELVSLINTGNEELVILILNLPEIDKAFKDIEGVIPLSDNWQVLATTRTVVNSINSKGKSGWFDILERYLPEDKWELDIDASNHPVTWFPNIPFDCWYEADKSFYQQATERALQILNLVDEDKVPECYIGIK